MNLCFRYLEDIGNYGTRVGNKGREVGSNRMWELNRIVFRSGVKESFGEWNCGIRDGISGRGMYSSRGIYYRKWALVSQYPLETAISLVLWLSPNFMKY